MNILRENVEHLNDVITIEIDATDYREQVEKSLKELKRKANIPGFRPGHVPMGMISKMYKKSIVADEISKMINDNLLNYIKENNINILFEPLALPDKTKGNFEKEEENFSFAFEIGIHPEFEVNYEKTKKINYLKINAAEKEIEEEIKKLQHKMGKFSSTEEVVAEDMLLVTVLAEEDNKEEFTASLLLSYIKDKKQKEFIGKKVHDIVQINTTEIFKSDYERSTFLKTKVDDLGNAPVNISIKIDAIHHIEPAELNAEFFDKTFPNSDVKDVKSLKEAIKKQIELSYERDEKMLYRNKIMNELIVHTTFELPDNFIKRFLVVNKSDDYTKANIDDKYPDIKKSISYQLIEDKISKDEAINVDNEEIRQYIKDYIRSSYFGVGNQVQLPEEQENQINNFTNEMMKKTDNLKNAYENIFSEKIIAAFIQKVNPKIENVSFDEFLESAEEKKKSAVSKKEKSKSVKK